jgi:hypothetical protein
MDVCFSRKGRSLLAFSIIAIMVQFTFVFYIFAWLLAFPVHELANAYVLVCITTKNKVRITSAGLFSNFIFIKNTNLSQG